MAASSAAASGSTSSPKKRETGQGMPGMIDIAVNLLDTMYEGVYNGKNAHAADLPSVLSRARAAHVEAQIICAGSAQEAASALALAAQHADLSCTVGCHPTRAGLFDEHEGGAHGYVKELEGLIRQGGSNVVAIGECGLDYDRLHFAPAESQRSTFALQLELQKSHALPLLLHSRAAHADFVSIMRPHLQSLREGGSPLAPQGDGKEARYGVVHSFDGTLEEAKELLELQLFIGINGCSMKTQESLEVVAQLPLERLLIETDAPWCEPRPSHASASHLAAYKSAHPDSPFFPTQLKKEKWSAEHAVKGRHEPAGLGQIAVVIAALKGTSVEEVASATTRNARWLFGLDQPRE